MKCTRCGKNEATVHSFISINNKKQQMDLCENCARELQSSMGMSGYGGIFGPIFGGSSMGVLPGLFTLFDAPTTQALVCPHCKTTGEEFVKTGCVGCEHCYEVFEPLIVQTLKKFQQSDRHIGKLPVGMTDTDGDEQKLKAELQAAIDGGEYGKITEIAEKLHKLTVGNNGEG